ncbi:MAG: hypothetical protein HQK53_14855 [Oligoflexia bacterium]|nr:hypothetical protein [Oligoflexia bacterium]
MKFILKLIVFSVLVSQSAAFASWNTLCVSKANDANYTVCGIAIGAKAPWAKCNKWSDDTLAAGSPITRVFGNTDLSRLQGRYHRYIVTKWLMTLLRTQIGITKKLEFLKRNSTT